MFFLHVFLQLARPKKSGFFFGFNKINIIFVALIIKTNERLKEKYEA